MVALSPSKQASQADPLVKASHRARDARRILSDALVALREAQGLVVKGSEDAHQGNEEWAAFVLHYAAEDVNAACGIVRDVVTFLSLESVEGAFQPRPQPARSPPGKEERSG